MTPMPPFFNSLSMRSFFYASTARITTASIVMVLAGCGSDDSVTQESLSAEPEAVRVGLLTVIAQPFIHRFSTQGNIETDRNTILTAEFAGLIESVEMREGESVRKGDALIRINTDVLDRSMSELQTQLDLAADLFNRQERLWKQSIGSELEFMQARTQLEALEKGMATLLEQRDMAVVRAPFDGILDRCLGKVGEMALPGSPLARVIDLRNLYVRASVSDHYAARVSKDMPAQVIVSDIDTIETRIGRVGQFINPANRTLELTLPLPDGTAFLPNMYASVWLQDVSIDSAKVIPSALIQQDIEGADYVFVAITTDEGLIAAKRFLDVGIGSGNDMLIEGGLEFGDQVVSIGGSRIVEGQRIRAISE
jgi:membrane fusion protein (multidrug efflux system)